MITAQQFANWREAVGGTRFIMSMGCAMINSLIFVFGRFGADRLLSENGYLTILGGTVFVYVAAATTQALTKGRDASVQPN